MDRKIIKPQSHAFFTEMYRFINYRIPNMVLIHWMEVCPGRTHLFREMLLVKFKAWDKAMIEFSIRDIDSLDMQKNFDRIILDLISEYWNIWVENGVPKIAIDKFDEWHKSNTDMYMKTIEYVCIGNSFSSVNEMKNAILSVSMAIMVQTIVDAERVMGNLNGSLTSLWFYKNYKFL